MLTGGEGELGHILARQGFAVQQDLPPVPVQAQDALEQGGLSCAVFPQEPHDLAPGQGQGDVVQGVLFAGVGFGDMA